MQSQRREEESSWAEKKQSKTIAERAYELWEKAGRPDGRDLEHWFQAETEGAKPEKRQRLRASETVPGQAASAPKVACIGKERRSRNSGRSSGRKK